MADNRYKNGVWQNRHRQWQRLQSPADYGWRQTPYQFRDHTLYQWPGAELYICTTPPGTGLADDWIVFVGDEARATFSGPLHKITAGALELLESGNG